jgi:uncharacterized membrane protein YGL010W
MTSLTKALSKVCWFLVDYGQRHAHPVNALLHLCGVPMAFLGGYRMLSGAPLDGLGLVICGYLLQYVGHRAQGNEVGEVTLIRHIWRRLTRTGATE